MIYNHRMRQARMLGNLFLAAAIVGLAVVFSPPTSAANVGTTWNTAVPVQPSSIDFLDYRQLSGTGDVVYYRLDVTQAARFQLRLSLSSLADEKFAPRVVHFRPSLTTIGPILPFEQPPQTLAVVYPMVPEKTVFDPYTQAAYDVRLQMMVMLNDPGRHYLAIYNAGSAAGQYRLEMSQGRSVAALQDTWMMPVQWWRDQTFAGFSWRTLITPGLIALGLWLVYLRLDHHQLHPHKKYPKRLARSAKKT